MENIIKTFQEIIKVNEQGIWRKAPFTLWFGFILEIGIFKFRAHIYS